MAERIDKDDISVGELGVALNKMDALMLVTMSGDGELGIRPMSVAHHDEPGILWFAASEDSFKVRDVEWEGRVFITGQQGGTYIAAEGSASFQNDQATKERLFKEPMRAWFAGGADDPDLGFIKVQLTAGRIWNAGGLDRVTYFFDSVRAYLTGEPPVTKIQETFPPM